MGTPKSYEYALLCDGSTISATNYPDLVAIIGTTLPNLTDKFLQGSTTAGTVKSAGLPNITGETIGSNWGAWREEHISGAFYKTTHVEDYVKIDISYDTSTTPYCGSYFDASRSSSIYGNSTTVQPPAVTTKFYICYA